MANLKINIVLVTLTGVLIAKGVCFWTDVTRFDEVLVISKNSWRTFCNKSEFDIEFNTKQNNSYNELRTCIGNVQGFSLVEIYYKMALDPEDAESCCVAFDSYQECLNNFTTSIDFCNDGKKIKAFELLEKFEYLICKDKGAPLKGIAISANNCPKEITHVLECLWAEVELVSKLVVMGNYFLPTQNLLDSTDCSRLEKLETCVTDKLDQCPDAVISPTSNTAKEIFKMIKNITSCEKKKSYEIFKI
ncbi:hypothetical protein HCN44_000909 [Aphidius gifuensis]|uniref:Uncharacterized protein n=1 Tax=Aphidius gifuensis TaxID=684658 RepID=A0A834XP82_APHGI|nr:uncharacterized protein LOC122856655 [Aphidius gifuensis]KAF7988336.1 hypothetical protein HCN44_000909 [Aphidius gifuensis]